MTYRAEFEGPALTQLKGLPRVAFDAMVDRIVDLVREPWEADLMSPGGDPALRQALFGHGYGMLSFRVDDAELLVIFDITWIG